MEPSRAIKRVARSSPWGQPDGMRGSPRDRQRGSIRVLPSKSLQVRVYAGHDPLTGRRHYLTEVVKAGPSAAAEAERVRTRLQNEVDERSNPVTRATLNQLLDRYLEVVNVEPTTKARYEGIARLHLRPALGDLPLAKIDGELLERFYAQLRVCRLRCGGRAKHVRHRTQRQHECDTRCRVVPCQPLSESSIRAAHWMLSAAFSRAVRWRWLGRNPIVETERPGGIKLNPSPPSPDQAARILAEAWKDPDWGAFIWTAMTTGARRGELCSLKREDVDLDNGVMIVRTAIKLAGKQLVRRQTKTHQQRRIALDPDTIDVLREHTERLDERAASIGVRIGPDGDPFTLAPDASEPLTPDTATQRYDRMVKRMGLKTTLHKLRHYSATELLSAGVDIRTVAGRLGHGSGGAMTLRAYAAWVSEADQRAALSMGGRLSRPAPTGNPSTEPLMPIGTKRDAATDPTRVV